VKKVLFVLLGLAVAAVLGLFAMCQVTSGKLKPVVNELMVECDAGRYAAAYEKAADSFKKENSEAAFQTVMETVKRALGAYKGLGSVKGFSTKRDTGAGDIDGVTVELIFEKATVDGKFSFVVTEDAYKLLSLNIDIPEANRLQADPEQLVPSAEALIQLFADGKLVGLYGRFTPELKEAWPADKFEEQMTPIRAALGAFQEASHVGTTPSEQGQRVEMKAVFEGGTKTVRINFFDRGGEWQPLGFAIGNE
jgi:uncharacterized protein YxeA